MFLEPLMRFARRPSASASSSRKDERPLAFRVNGEPLPDTVEAGRALLDRYVFKRRGNQVDHDDYKLGVVSSKCLIGSEGAPIAQKLCRGIKAAVDSYDAYASEQDDLLKALLKRQPVAVLDELANGTKTGARASS